MDLIHNNRPRQLIDRPLSDDNDFIKVPVPQSYEKVTYPFEGDTTNLLLSQDFIVGTDYYPENIPVIGSLHEDYPLFFVHDENKQDDQWGLTHFTRIWAMLPGFDGKKVSYSLFSGSLFTRKETESHVWSKPSVATADSQTVNYYVDTATSVPTIAAGKIKLYTFNAVTHNINTNYQTATVSYLYSVAATGNFTIWQQLQTYTSPIYSRGSTWIQVDSVEYGSGVYYLQFSRPKVKINSIPKTVSTIIYFDYFLEGLNVDSIENIPLIQQWKVLDENLNETDTITEISHPPLYTTGTETGYYDLVNQGYYICVEPSVVHRKWGNIFERQTRYAKII